MAPNANYLSELWRRGAMPDSAATYIFAVCCVAPAAVVHAGALLVSNDILPFVPYYPAVLATAFIGGALAAGLTVILSAALVWWAFPSPYFGAGAPLLIQTINLAFYVTAAAIMIRVAQFHRRLTRGADNLAAMGEQRQGKWRRLILEGLPSNSPEGYLLAAACIVVATLVRFAMGWVGGDVLLFASYFPAVLVVSLLAGARMGVFAVALSAVAVWWAFLPSHAGSPWATQSQMAGLAFFVFTASLTVWVVEYRCEELEADGIARHKRQQAVGRTFWMQHATLSCPYCGLDLGLRCEAGSVVEFDIKEWEMRCRHRALESPLMCQRLRHGSSR